MFVHCKLQTEQAQTLLDAQLEGEIDSYSVHACKATPPGFKHGTRQQDGGSHRSLSVFSMLVLVVSVSVVVQQPCRGAEE